MAHLVKCSLHKLEVLRSDPHLVGKGLTWWLMLVMSVLGRQRQEAPRGSLVNWPNLLAEFLDIRAQAS